MNALWFSLLFVASSVGSVAPTADRISFTARPGARTLKVFIAKHELRIDEMGIARGDLPFVSDGTGGWISSTHRVEFLDEYVRVENGKPLEFLRQVRECIVNAKANVTRANGLVLTEQAPGASPLRRQKLRFTWSDRLNEWSRCYAETEGEENWLSELYGDFDFLRLLPAGEVEPGATWSVDVEALRTVLSPGGNHKITPATEKLFGRVVEIGVGGDFGDVLASELGGEVTATYVGQRKASVGVGDAAVERTVAELSYELALSSSNDRLLLYLMAMPDLERREPARVEAVPLDYTLHGKATLLWDIEAGRAHTFLLEGQESFDNAVTKTMYDGRQATKVSQIARYSGPLKVEITFLDGSGVDDKLEPPRVAPRQK